MSDGVTVSSSTDTQEQVNTAARYGSSKPAPEAEKAEPISEAEQAETEAVSETATEEEQPEESEEEQSEEVIGKTRRKLLRQVSRLNGRNIALQEQLEETNERLRRLEGKKPDVAPQPASGKPSPAQYSTYEDYVEALAEWKVTERDRAAAQARQDEYLKQVFDGYNQQVQQARNQHEDFDEVVGQAVSVPVIAINAMYEMDNGAEVAYFLGEHPEVRDQLLEWNAPGTKGGFRKIIVELDRISGELGGNRASDSKNGPSPKPRPQTSAPVPIRPLGGGSSTRSATAKPDEMSFADYKKWYAKTYGR